MSGVDNLLHGGNRRGGKEAIRASTGRASGWLDESERAARVDSRDDLRARERRASVRDPRHQRSDVLQASQSRAAGLPGGPRTQAAWPAAAVRDRRHSAGSGVGRQGQRAGGRTGGPDRAAGNRASAPAAGLARGGRKKNETPAHFATQQSTQEVIPEEPSSRVGEHAAVQWPRRAEECQAREAAVRFVQEQVSSCRGAAHYLRVPSRTLAHWRRRHLHGELVPRLRGRPCREVTHEERVCVDSLLNETGPRLGLPSLQACFSDVPRCVLAYVLEGYRQRFQAEHRLVVETLQWFRAGSVWAIDHTTPPRPVDGCYEQILAVRDLASGMQLAWTPVRNATAVEALLVLESLVARYGPPLVMKSDNGSAFTSQLMDNWLTDRQIVPLFSPVRTPRFNGSCEAGIGGMKRRTEIIAARFGRFIDWACDDLDAALMRANHDHYPYGLAAGTAATRFAARPTLGEAERNTFHAAIVQCEQQLRTEASTAGHVLTDKLLAAYHRRAVRQVLVELGYLSITRRSIPQPIRSAKCARIR
jgi:transposase InsO family protein